MTAGPVLPPLLRDVLEILPGAVSVAQYEKGRGWVYGSIYDSPGMRELYGLERIGPDRRPGALLRLIHPDDRERFLEAGRRVVEERRDVEVRFRIRHGVTGEERWILERARGVPGETPDQTIVVTLAVDDTEHQTAYESLRLSEEMMRSLVEGSRNLFFYLQGSRGEVLYVSPSVEAITGYTAERWKGQSHWFTTDNPINEIARRRTRRHLAGERTEGPFKVEILHADGHPILLEVIEEPAFEDGVPVGIRGLARNITREHELEERLAQARRMEAVGRLAAGLAHDLNNLLQGIVAAAELAHLKARDTDAVRPWLDRILELTSEGRTILSDLLASTERRLLRKERIDLGTLAREAAELAGAMDGGTVGVTVVPSEEPLPVLADRSSVLAAIMALAESIRRDLPPGAGLRLATRREGDRAVLEIEGTGPGSGAGAHAVAPDLTGVRGTIEQHGGTIGRSGGDGARERFTVSLPLAMDEDGPPAEAMAAEPGRPRGRKVLVVDDNEPFLEAILPILEDAGFEVMARGTLAAAREALASDPEIAVVVLDLRLPDGSGVELVDETDRPVVLMSGYAMGSLPPGTASIPERAVYLEKPFPINRLLEAIDGLLED